MENKWDMGKNIAKATASEVNSLLMAANCYPVGLLQKIKRKNPLIFDGSSSDQQTHKKTSSLKYKNTHPVVLVHGIAHNASAFVKMQDQMKKQGWINVFTVNYDNLHGDILKMVEQLSLQVDKVLKVTKKSQVDIVAHSLGGLVSRYYMVLGSGQGKVRHLVTLGTAHKGTRLSPFLKLFSSTKALSKDLYENSSFLKTLQQATLPKNTTMTSIYSKCDWAIWPQGNGLAEGIPQHAFKNIQLESVGHVGLLYDTDVFQHVIESLKSQ